MQMSSVRSVAPRETEKMLETVVIVFHLLGALGVVALVLLQQGKGADAGASFGAGASNTVFGGQGTSTFLSKFTAILAACFFITSLGLGYFAKEKAQQLTQVGLPDPAVLEVKQKPAADDVPVLEGQKPAVVPADVPQAPEKK
ncbi:Preprotein translocase, subunit SecG [Pseudomonas syringae pv. helianthi]|uniref:Protein-export membrane protein SecG n=10 Tax=Pseudomonas syringae group TaxID=136849 RepID=A0A3M6H778_PSEAJ|nr:Preprotein translocase [Pseudomonas amygdali pv. lachrymans]KPX42692.1 Preprotein translocase, subunit SecG [Pseudomonas syringae pv. helianthi]RMO31310.1 Preprotein translocase, subunit SecG [Pseudomonas savastanoi pv. glycinea]RMP82768.1 Preprotein translocase subunit SecG [Pseudomonas syringae pv. actinidiae]RMT35676.1 Preprotein translocase, subunit SecG [Pseudomonas savastanoi]RMW00687.1 Preprotein translocase, subunit SecG [Pseudomonas amygdali pv. tabaci]